eukprot:1960512-Prymnesium_polylepis.1
MAQQPLHVARLVEPTVPRLGCLARCSVHAQRSTATSKGRVGHIGNACPQVDCNSRWDTRPHVQLAPDARGEPPEEARLRHVSAEATVDPRPCRRIASDLRGAQPAHRQAKRQPALRS